MIFNHFLYKVIRCRGNGVVLHPFCECKWMHPHPAFLKIMLLIGASIMKYVKYVSDCTHCVLLLLLFADSDRSGNCNYTIWTPTPATPPTSNHLYCKHSECIKCVTSVLMSTDWAEYSWSIHVIMRRRWSICTAEQLIWNPRCTDAGGSLAARSRHCWCNIKMTRQSQVVCFSLQESLKPHKYELTSQLLGQMWHHQDVCALSHAWTDCVWVCVWLWWVFFLFFCIKVQSLVTCAVYEVEKEQLVTLDHIKGRLDGKHWKTH